MNLSNDSTATTATQTPPNGAHSAVNVLLDTAYQGINAAQWDKLFSKARGAKLEQFILIYDLHQLIHAQKVLKILL